MTETASATGKCEFCDKRGLPLLLVRDALVPVKTGAPVSSDKPFDVPEQIAYYTRRVLRNGFVNVYDEARKRWEVYYVTGDGYFFKMPLRSGVFLAKPNKPFNCPDAGHRAVASCITVPDPINATKVWIGFSDVLWTDKVRARNEQPAHRQKHMVAVDVAAVLAGGKQASAQCRPINQVSAIVAEYAMTAPNATAMFSWNIFQFYSRETRAARLVAECEALRPGKGQIVTVPDPAGIAAELALIMKRNSDFYNEHPSRRRQLKVDIAITGIESSIRDSAILKAYDDAEKSTRQFDRMGAVSESTVKRYAALKEAAVELTDAQRKKAGDDAWEKYAEKINQAGRQAWQKAYAKNLAIYVKTWVDPLATAHVALMRSSVLGNYFDMNFDDADIDSGGVYVNTVTMCVLATQDKPACAKLYAEWINGEFSNKRNFLLRALIANQEKLAKQIDETVKVTIDPRSIPWDNLIGLYAESIKGPTVDVIAKAVVFFGGAFAHVLGKWIVDATLIRGSIFVMGMIAKRSLVRIELTDKRMAFRKMIAKQLINKSGLAIDPKKLSQAISAELHLQGVSGKKLPGNVRATWIIFIDKVIPGLDPAATEDEKIAHVLKYLRSVESLEGTEQFNKVRTVLSTDVKVGTLALIIQCICFNKLIEDEQRALPEGKLEARWKLRAGFLGLCGTFAELIANAYKGVLALKLGASNVPLTIDAFIRKTKAFGICGALIVSGFDFAAARKSFIEGDVKMGLLWGFSAVGGGVLASCMAFPGLLGFLGVFAFPVLGLLFLGVIALGLIIENLKDNAIEDWLERTLWGTFPAERYPNEKLEMEAYYRIFPKD